MIVNAFLFRLFSGRRNSYPGIRTAARSDPLRSPNSGQASFHWLRTNSNAAGTVCMRSPLLPHSKLT